jgi:hypothetical protein
VTITIHNSTVVLTAMDGCRIGTGYADCPTSMTAIDFVAISKSQIGTSGSASGSRLGSGSAYCGVSRLRCLEIENSTIIADHQ